MTRFRIVIRHPVIGVPITFLDKYNPAQFEIVAIRKGDSDKMLVFTRDSEKEFNHMFVASSEVNYPESPTDSMVIQWNDYLCKNDNLAKIEPIDFFFPLVATNRAAGTMNGLMNGRETYRRILIRKKV